jgi:hypothetical protein
MKKTYLFLAFIVLMFLAMCIAGEYDYQIAKLEAEINQIETIE